MNEFLYFILGLIIPVIIQIFVFPFLPPKIRDFARYYKKKFSKILRQQEVSIELVVKTKKYDGDPITIDKIIESMKKMFQKFSVSSTNTTLIIKVPVGQDEVDIEIIPMHYVDDDDGILKFKSLECHFASKCRFSKLGTAVMNFTEAQKKIQNILYDKDLPRFDERLSLTCRLKSLHEITTILEDTHFELINAELETGQRFEIGTDNITIYDKEISDNTIALAKKMIILYD